MATLVGNRPVTSIKSSQKFSSENRSHKITKKQRDKKFFKNSDVEAVIEAAESKSPEVEDAQDGRHKKAQGIVIDGRTYTCATCKTGHRVGVCKHARDRPMTATHPPGRPPAGAPKKVVCDCPKQCSCKKRDCKCARDCNCTQMMYMLVYISAPGENVTNEDENGSWQLGQQVTTDLKGNVLSNEQIQERQEQKEIQKNQTPEKQSAILGMTTPMEAGLSNSFIVNPSSNPSSKPEGGCCKHKENISSQPIISEMAPQPGALPVSAAKGCNCGHTCACAFCPEHPNNSTSTDMARKQVMHFANHPYLDTHQSIMPFMPMLPNEASCMGGLPQFAISRYSQPPSQYELQQAFPQPGYVITYPVSTNRLDSLDLPAPFPIQHQVLSNLGSTNGSGLGESQISPVLASQVGLTHSELPRFDYAPDEFDIGDAFVSNAGSGVCEDPFAPSTLWKEGSVSMTPVIDDFTDCSEFLVHDNENLVSDNISMRLNSNLMPFKPFEVGDEIGYRQLDIVATAFPGVDAPNAVNLPHSCCERDQD